MLTTTYTISEIAKITGGEILVDLHEEKNIDDILIDSRRLISATNCLFIPLITKKNDGHKFIEEVYHLGVRNFLISKPDIQFKDANCILVNNTLEALQKIAIAHRKKFDIPIIGITGSNGKTIVKEWLFQLLSDDYLITRSPKSYNSQIGVPLSVWQLKPESQLGIFEAGISEPDEMSRLQPIINPSIGIFTNIGGAHSENFITNKQKAGEKLKLFTKVKTLIYSPDYDELQETIIRSELLESITAFTWSHKIDADLKITEVNKSAEKLCKISAVYKKKNISISIPFLDDASIENAIHCWAAMLCLGYSSEKISERMQKLQSIAMRLEMKEGINHCSIINDSYNSDINSLNIALDFLNQQNQHTKKSVILSDILQSGLNESDLYGEIAGLLKQKGISRFIGIGPAISKQASQFDMASMFFPDTQEFLKKFSFAEFQNESILLKGARVFEFEQISHALQQKAHETVLEINLNAVVNNLDYYRKKITPGTRIMAMVKAFSYGSGSFEIANILQFHNIDYLAVAYADEGVELRKAGIKTPIMVMNPDEQSFDAIIKHNLEPEIYNFRSLKLLEEATRANIIPDNKPVKVHIKLDTGMHRLGFTEDEVNSLIERLMNIRLIYVESVFSHLASSEDPSDDDFSKEQIAAFKRMAQKIKENADHHVMMHILNSAGISRFPDAQFDMVRLGISLYGIPNSQDDIGMLDHVSTLKSTISQIKTIQAGESVGYNRQFKATEEMQIAVVPVGYADGLNRKLGNGNGYIYIRNQKAPIVGNICMDMCMIDVSGIDVKEGDDVIIFGKEYPISEMAKTLDTIPYEVLTNISRRVKRVYYHE
ncbi:MAG: bifunctional UDP-N-acetylmuramoyl-tripeptide:D-alanyl-D-alanine ligase/alanine racemase [Bacteroidales bacterium]|nr:bifunctional UDP-N-acetylmuramoyl-tripeptide:D-alanyl-D-alanine ligase/alanine racemase [Bacteroidales bacterium]MCF8403199.1 bifunctional UDP-N-acetylmuramoyl-tripeptide:D-alanyl-D-alanine ligase/alanine racemase [Bacteroidales bacterium]